MGGVPYTHTSGAQTHYVIAINLSFTSVRFVDDGRVLVDGTLVPGAILMTAPGASVEVTYRLPCDVLHIYVSQQFLSKCYEDAFGAPCGNIVEMVDTRVRRDVTIERLGQLLASAKLWGKSERAIFYDGIGRAIVSRIVERWFALPTSNHQRSFGLPRWRLSRAMAYIDAHLTERIRTHEIAESAGLSRMHFAAQFRLALEVSPHEYVLRKRLELARKLLLETDRNTLEIALSCGFNSQTHFISVFSRYIGVTPCRWRKDNRKE